MEGLIVLDSSVLIELFRKKDKSKTFFYTLASQFNGIAIPVVVHYEIWVGSSDKQDIFWKNLFNDFLILPYITAINYTAILFQKELKAKRKSIAFSDLLIAASAMYYSYPLATLNKKHFENISNLQLTTP